MDQEKLTDAYCYLSLKGAHKWEGMALKMLWLADFNHLRRYGRTVTGSEFPIVELPEIRTVKCQCGISHGDAADAAFNAEYGPFGALSLSDKMELDSAFADVFRTENTSDETDDLQVRTFSSLEEVFEGEDPEYAKAMIEDIRERAALEKYFGSIVDEK